jgi:hypothetical protein
MIENDNPKADALAEVCMAVDADSRLAATRLLREKLPFEPIEKIDRKYSKSQMMRIFNKDGFLDRYSGKKLVFPGTLRLISIYFKDEFPFHSNWKTSESHFAYYELCPTIDHVVPVTRGGSDSPENLVTTSQLLNSAKANFTLEELGWRQHNAGRLEEWDGLTEWFLRQTEKRPETLNHSYISEWRRVATLSRAVHRP